MTPHTLDLVFVALIAVAWPLYEYFVDWPSMQRATRDHPASARESTYARTILSQWLLFAAGAALWLRGGRTWTDIGLLRTVGWRTGVFVGLVLAVIVMYSWQAYVVVKSAETRAYLREQLATVNIKELLPHTTRELVVFLLASLTAGVCEEFLFRGYFFVTLTPLIGSWGAAALGVPVFGLLHGYQGRSGILRTALAGAFLTLILAATRSLIPAIVLHTLMDAGSGIVMWIALSDGPANSPTAAAVAS